MGTILQLKEIGMKFGSNILFQNVNLTFEEGSTTALIGANGTGKSTLINRMAGRKVAAIGNNPGVTKNFNEVIKLDYFYDEKSKKIYFVF